jgi:rhodanese-related sulfurtransferase
MKRLNLIVFCLLLFSYMLSAQSEGEFKYKSLEPYDFQMEYLRADSAMLVDVREHFEFRGKKIREAINIPSSGDTKKASDTISKNYALFFYCTTDFRSRRVAEFFSDQGFERVFSLQGGIKEWKQEGYPVTRKKTK